MQSILRSSSASESESMDATSRSSSSMLDDATLDHLKQYYPTAVEEQRRLNLVHAWNLFDIELPIASLNKLMLDKTKLLKKHFPNAASIFVTAFAEESYRTLYAATFDQRGQDFFQKSRRKSKYAEFGCKNLSACQYVVSKGATLQFNESTDPPKFLELFRESRGRFEWAMRKTDPLYKGYRKDARKRGVWKALQMKMKGPESNESSNFDMSNDPSIEATLPDDNNDDNATAVPQDEIPKDIHDNLVNMFELFTIQELNYVGIPIKYRHYTLGVLCLLYTRDGRLPSSRNVQMLEDLALEVADCLSKFKEKESWMGYIGRMFSRSA